MPALASSASHLRIHRCISTVFTATLAPRSRSSALPNAVRASLHSSSAKHARPLRTYDIGAGRILIESDASFFAAV